MKEDIRWLEEMKHFPEIADMLFEEFCRERIEYSEIVNDLIKAGFVVISDRFYPSTVCYQFTSCDKYDCEKLLKIFKKYYHQWKKPDIILIPSTPFPICVRRVRARNEEVDVKFLREVKKCYNKLVDALDNAFYVKNKNHALEIVKDLIKQKAPKA
jgi:thymidylate kinase